VKQTGVIAMDGYGRIADGVYLESWTGMCLGNRQSAGSRFSGKTRQGSPWLRTALIKAAHAVARPKTPICQRSTTDWQLDGEPKRRLWL